MTTDDGGIPQRDEGDEEKGAEVIDLAAERAKVDPEIQEVEDDTEAFCLAVEGAVDEEAREKARQMLLKRLDKAVDSWARVEFLSKVADWGCLDAIVGAAFPEVGDVAAATVEIGYLLGEANLAADMDWKKQSKVAAYQLVDLAIGLVPVVGDVGDLFFMANRMSAKEFRENVGDKAQEALAAGVPKENVDKVLAKHENLIKHLNLADKVVSIGKKAGGGSGGGAASGGEKMAA